MEQCINEVNMTNMNMRPNLSDHIQVEGTDITMAKAMKDKMGWDEIGLKNERRI